jgi:hypothetical protein
MHKSAHSGKGEEEMPQWRPGQTFYPSHKMAMQVWLSSTGRLQYRSSLLLSRITVPVLFYLFNKRAYLAGGRAVVGSVTPRQDMYAPILVGSSQGKNL